MSKNSKVVKDDDVLLNSFSNTTSVKSKISFWLNAVVTSIAPIYLFTNINQIDVMEQVIPLSTVCLLSIYAVIFASNNFKHVLKQKIIMKRADAVSRELSKKYANDKNMSKKEKDERIIFRRDEVAENEATYLTIFLVNSSYIAALFTFAFLLLANLQPIFTTVLSIAGGAGVVAFLSTSKN